MTDARPKPWPSITHAPVAAALALAPHLARAEPHVELARCTAFDVRALRLAIDRELPTEPALRARDFAVVVECPDAATARLHVEPAFADGMVARELDLGEVPDDVRLKLLALAVAELVEVAGADTSGPAPPAAAIDLPPQQQPPVVRAHATAGLPVTASTVDGSAQASPIDSGLGATTTATARPSPSRATFGVTAGVRYYASTPTALAQLGLELGLPWLRVGVRGAIGETSVALGTLQPYVATVTLARALVCSSSPTSLCLLARVEGGVAGVMAQARSPVLATASDASALYGQGSLAGELARTFAGWSLLVSLEAGWSTGMVARSNGSDAAALAGVLAIASVGARWR
jgi:hypothetical protein